MILIGEKKKRRKKTDRQTKQPRRCRSIDHNELSHRMKKKVVGSDQSIS